MKISKPYSHDKINGISIDLFRVLKINPVSGHKLPF